MRLYFLPPVDWDPASDLQPTKHKLHRLALSSIGNGRSSATPGLAQWRMGSGGVSTSLPEKASSPSALLIQHKAFAALVSPLSFQ
eukprot:3331985-Amphidinium_carterae.1